MSSTTTPLFTVIVPTYGRASLLAHALESIRTQTVDDFECLVVDDASPDVPRLPDDERFRLLRHAVNQGPAAARNTALAAARGRFVAFLDDDDLFLPNRLDLALEGLSRAPVAICWDDFVDGGPGGHRSLDGDVADRILDGTTPQLGATAIRRDHAVPFAPEFQPCEDVEWWLRVARAAPIATVPRVGFLYRRHGSQRHRTDQRSRIAGSHALLVAYSDWFAAHPRAAAFRWKRIGLMSLDQGDRRAARGALARSLRLHPEPRTAWHLLRSAA